MSVSAPVVKAMDSPQQPQPFVISAMDSPQQPQHYPASRF
jgi:hypothetical protein